MNKETNRKAYISWIEIHEMNYTTQGVIKLLKLWDSFKEFKIDPKIKKGNFGRNLTILNDKLFIEEQEINLEDLFLPNGESLNTLKVFNDIKIETNDKYKPLCFNKKINYNWGEINSWFPVLINETENLIIMSDGFITQLSSNYWGCKHSWRQECLNTLNRVNQK